MDITAGFIIEMAKTTVKQIVRSVMPTKTMRSFIIALLVTYRLLDKKYLETIASEI